MAQANNPLCEAGIPPVVGHTLVLRFHALRHPYRLLTSGFIRVLKGWAPLGTLGLMLVLLTSLKQSLGCTPSFGFIDGGVVAWRRRIAVAAETCSRIPRELTVADVAARQATSAGCGRLVQSALPIAASALEVLPKGSSGAAPGRRWSRDVLSLSGGQSWWASIEPRSEGRRT